MRLQERLGYVFKNTHLLEQALTHRSVKGQHNERLEFLGDAILGFIIADELYQRYPQMKEGDLSRVRSGLVKREMLTQLAHHLELTAELNLGHGEIKSGGQYRESILADAVEAIIAAIYLDSQDIRACKSCVLSWYGEADFEILAETKLIKDAKTRLQEWLQAAQFSLPDYTVTTSGKAHQQQFEVICKVRELPYETKGQDSSRKKAEQMAAEKYLQWVLKQNKREKL